MQQIRQSLLSKSANWFALAGLLFQLFIPFFHHPAMAMPMPQSEPVPICSMGMTQNEMAKSEQGEKTEKKTPSCPICQTLHQLHNGFIQPDAPFVLTASARAIIIDAAWQRIILAALIEPAARPRAPPVFA